MFVKTPLNSKTLTTFRLSLLFILALSVFNFTSFEALGKNVSSKKALKPVLHIQHWVSASGVPVYWVPAPSIPLLEARLIFNAGSARDGNQSGLAFLTSRLLMTGTPSMNVDQIAETLDTVGAAYHLEVSEDDAVLYLRTLTEKKALNVVLNTFKAILGHPSFPRPQFDRLKKQTLRDIRERQQRPHVLATQHFFKQLYKGGGFYAAPVGGELNSVQRLTLEAVRRFYRQFYTRKNAKLVLVGAVTRQQAEAIANQLVRDLPQGRPAKPLPLVEVRAKPSVNRISFPSAQSTVLMGHLGTVYGDKEYASLIVGNHILGQSSLTSRLFHDVRDQLGLAYFVSSYFHTLKARGPFIIALQTRTSKVKQAIAQTRSTLDTFLKQGPTPAELELAKNNIVGGFVVDNLTSNRSIADLVSVLASYDLPLDYFDEYLAQVKSLTQQQVLSDFRQHIHPEQFVTVIVGQTPEK